MKRRLALASIAAVSLGAASWHLSDRPDALSLPETVYLPATSQAYRPAGDFRHGTRVLDAPEQKQQIDPLEIMKYHVTEAEYSLCVAEDACPSLPSRGRENFAQTGVNHFDATSYATWLSRRTGQDWRLPTDPEWLRAAAERGSDDRLSDEANGIDPSRRWIESYLREVELRGNADLLAHPLGHFGANSIGIADIAGNIWDWTETCFQNGTLSADGTEILNQSDYCGVRAVQGKHRAFVIDFIRNARSGGCAAGVPPDYLGFRLVRDRAAGGMKNTKERNPKNGRSR